MADRDIACLRWLVFDVDPVRPTGVSATDSEKAAAVDVPINSMSTSPIWAGRCL